MSSSGPSDAHLVSEIVEVELRLLRERTKRTLVEVLTERADQSDAAEVLDRVQDVLIDFLDEQARIRSQVPTPERS